MLAVLLILVRQKIIWLLKEIPLLALFIVLRIGGNLQNVRHIYLFTNSMHISFGPRIEFSV